MSDPSHPRLIAGGCPGPKALGGMSAAKVRKAILRSASAAAIHCEGRKGH